MAINYTPEEITEILNDYFSGITHKQYIGARYVPIFGRKDEESILWDNTGTYEPLTIVLYQGNSYTSRQYVPIGVEITNQEYWANTGNYNAQVEQYRQEVFAAVERIVTIEDVLPVESFDSTNTVKKGLDDLSSEINDLESNLEFENLENETIVVFSDSTFQRNNNPLTNVMQTSVCEYLDSLSNATVVNYGVGGYTSTQILSQIQALNETQIATLEDSTIVIVAMGTNDWQSNFNLFPITNTTVSTYGNTLKIINELSALAPKAQIIFVTPGYCSSDYLTTNVFDINETGNYFNAYCELINYACYSRNIPCMRLDRILGINSINFKHKMVPSGSASSSPQYQNVYVHYTQETNEHIARSILSNLHKMACEFVPGVSFDITPSLWVLTNNKAMNPNYYLLGNLCSIEHGSTVDEISFTTPVLQDGVDYFVSFVGQNPNVYIDNELVCKVSIQGAACFKISGSGEAKTIVFKNRTSGTALTIGIPKLSIGRPDVFNYGYKQGNKFTESKNTYLLQDKNNYFNVYYRNSEGLKIGKLTLKTSTTFTMPSSNATPITDLNTTIFGACDVFGWINTSEHGINPISLRLNTDGKLYVNEHTFEGDTVIGLSLTIVGIQL